MSAIPPKADIAERDRHVRFVPIADMDQHGRDVPLCARSRHKGIGSPMCRTPEKTCGGSREYSSVSTGWRVNGKYEFKAGTAGVGF